MDFAEGSRYNAQVRLLCVGTGGLRVGGRGSGGMAGEAEATLDASSLVHCDVCHNKIIRVYTY